MKPHPHSLHESPFDTQSTAHDSVREDIVYVDATTTTVSCAGEGVRNGGHPRVYLPLKKDKGYVICPYCHRRFVLKD
ncbi:MAG: zinc-finger domain-containing protein [Alphaproteobacteria bacterium GM202ARS2]|nr:zinc-finger domain-containing protein [Alphaproteobacteria bacterium GM202ARS2]